ncbi:aspartate dehydrogenase domain-containing protein [Janibacter corallicola]|uniref:aspartate dehydrogenase domain-containing protein n=1 Tax=Janibacter corallicola TaxID=415212 RepID=UPI000829C7F6|nr:aspartate dehydrogenase domain-containing protein [Janibacter corallicola]
MNRRVAVVGHGVIGARVARELSRGRVPGADLVGVVVRREPVEPPGPLLTLEQALEEADLVVECAGQPVVHELVDPVLSRGADLVIASVGALLDERLGRRLGTLGPGRLLATHGAVGGLDLLASAARSGGLESVHVRTTKTAPALVRDWMSVDEVRRITEATAPVCVFSGRPGEAARLFPDSLNVVAGVATAIGSTEHVSVDLVGDPGATRTTHEITASGDIGDYSFVIRNRPSEQNPRTSAVTAWSVLQTIASLTERAPLIA